MHRFFIPDLRIKDRLATVTDERLIHQIRRVLRLRPGQELTLFDGVDAVNHVMEILEFGSKGIQLHLLGDEKNDLEPRRIVHLYQAIPKKAALFDLMLQKGTEIGAAHFHPLITSRAENAPLSKLPRRRSIVIEAAEQCGRPKIPLLHSPITFAEAIQKAIHPYLAYEFAKRKSLTDFWPTIQKQSEVSVFIGPEGGFTNDEINDAEALSIPIFSLGKRILRVETASIAALSLLLLAHLDS